MLLPYFLRNHFFPTWAELFFFPGDLGILHENLMSRDMAHKGPGLGRLFTKLHKSLGIIVPEKAYLPSVN